MKVKAVTASCYIIATTAALAVPSILIQSSSIGIYVKQPPKHVLVRRSGNKKGNASKQQNSPNTSPSQRRTSSPIRKEQSIRSMLERPRPPSDVPPQLRAKKEERLSSFPQRPRPPPPPTSKVGGSSSPKAELSQSPGFADQAGPSRSATKQVEEVPNPKTKWSNPPVLIDRYRNEFHVDKDRKVVMNPLGSESLQTPGESRAQGQSAATGQSHVDKNPYSVLENLEKSSISGPDSPVSRARSPSSRTSNPSRVQPSSSKPTNPQDKQQASSSKTTSLRKSPKHKKVNADLPGNARWGQDWHTTSVHVPNSLKPYENILRPGSPERGWVTPGQEHLALKRMKEKPGAWAHATATAHGPAYVSALTPSGHTSHLVANTGGTHQTHAGAHDPDLAVVHGKSFPTDATRRTTNNGRITSRVMGKYVGSRIITGENGHAHLTITDASGNQSKAHIANAPKGYEREDNTYRLHNASSKQQTLEATLHGHGRLYMYGSQRPLDLDFEGPDAERRRRRRRRRR